METQKEITEFFCHSDFTWNQSWQIQSLTICQFYTLRLWILSFMIFCTFCRLNFTQATKFRSPKMVKTSNLELLDCPELISRKIWVTEKSWNYNLVKRKCGIVSVWCKFRKNNRFPSNGDKNTFLTRFLSASW